MSKHACRVEGVWGSLAWLWGLRAIRGERHTIAEGDSESS